MKSCSTSCGKERSKYKVTAKTFAFLSHVLYTCPVQATSTDMGLVGAGATCNSGKKGDIPQRPAPRGSGALVSGPLQRASGVLVGGPASCELVEEGHHLPPRKAPQAAFCRRYLVEGRHSVPQPQRPRSCVQLACLHRLLSCLIQCSAGRQPSSTWWDCGF